MARIDRRMVMAVLWALAQASREASVARPERLSTRWSLNMARLRRGVVG